MEFLKSQDQILDTITKPLKFKDFARFRSLLGLIKQVKGVLNSKLILIKAH